MATPPRFNWKATISFYVTWSFLALTVSGLVLYVAPPGRVANWSIWTLIGLSKAQWQAVHTVFSLLFVGAGITHLVFNWNVLVAYLTSKARVGIRHRREAGLATAVACGVFIMSAAGIPPFSLVMEVGDSVKNAWVAPVAAPPVPHAEELTIGQLAESVKIPAETARQNLVATGVAVASPTLTVQQIADANHLTPQQVFQRMQSAQAQPKVSLGGSGWGRKTVGEICQQYGVPASTGVARLAAAGLTATSDTSLKDVALAAGRTPMDIAALVVGPDGTIVGPTTHPESSRK